MSDWLKISRTWLPRPKVAAGWKEGPKTQGLCSPSRVWVPWSKSISASWWNCQWCLFALMLCNWTWWNSYETLQWAMECLQKAPTAVFAINVRFINVYVCVCTAQTNTCNASRTWYLHVALSRPEDQIKLQLGMPNMSYIVNGVVSRSMSLKPNIIWVRP